MGLESKLWGGIFLGAQPVATKIGDVGMYDLVFSSGEQSRLHLLKCVLLRTTEMVLFGLYIVGCFGRVRPQPGVENAYQNGAKSYAKRFK